MIKTPESLRRFVQDGNRLYKGGGGGDGGAAAREAAEKSRIAAAIAELNKIFDGGAAQPTANVNKEDFYKTERVVTNPFPAFPQLTSSETKTVFDEAGYNAAVKAAQEAASKSPQASSRETTYNKISTDAVNKAKVDLDKDKEFVTRDLGFMLARQGLSGGSRDVDVKKDVLDKYQQGLLRASEIGTQTANNARSADEKTRVNLISSIQAGLDSGTAAQQAYEGMRTNALKAQDEANAVSLSGFFDSLRQLQQQSAYNDQYGQVVNPQKRTATPSATARYGGTTGGSY